MRRIWPPLVAVLCTLAFAGAALAAVAMTGNPQGIKLAKKVMRSLAQIPAYKQTERGFFQIRTDAKSGEISYLFGQAHRAGYAMASEQETIALHHNHVRWWQDALKPASGNDSPVVLVLDRRGRYAAFGTLQHHGCFKRLAKGSTFPYRVGHLGYSIGGRIGAPKYRRSSAILPYVYQWKTHQKTTETDVIERQVDLVNSAKVVIAAGKGYKGFSFEFGNSYPSGAPTAPKVNLCK